MCFNPSILFGLEITPAASFAQAAPGEKVKIGKTAAGQTKSGPREVEPALPRDLRASERPFGVGAADRAPGPRPAAKSPGRLSESQAPPPGPERQGPLFLQGGAGAGRRVGGPPTCRLPPSPGPLLHTEQLSRRFAQQTNVLGRTESPELEARFRLLRVTPASITTQCPRCSCDVDVVLRYPRALDAVASAPACDFPAPAGPRRPRP